MRAGIDPVQAMNTLKDRLITVQMHDLSELATTGHDVPWGAGVGKTEQIIKEMHRLGIKPVMWGLEYSHNFLESGPGVAKSIEFFNSVSLRMEKEAVQ